MTYLLIIRLAPSPISSSNIRNKNEDLEMGYISIYQKNTKKNEDDELQINLLVKYEIKMKTKR